MVSSDYLRDRSSLLDYDVRGRRLHRNGDRFVYNQWGDLIAIYQYDEVAEEYELGYEYAYLPVDVDVPGDGRRLAACRNANAFCSAVNRIFSANRSFPHRRILPGE